MTLLVLEALMEMAVEWKETGQGTRYFASRLVRIGCRDCQIHLRTHERGVSTSERCNGIPAVRSRYAADFTVIVNSASTYADSEKVSLNGKNLSRYTLRSMRLVWHWSEKTRKEKDQWTTIDRIRSAP